MTTKISSGASLKSFLSAADGTISSFWIIVAKAVGLVSKVVN
jgi:hypothetical protein